MKDTRVFPLPFGEVAQLECVSTMGQVTLVPLMAGEEPRLEASAAGLNEQDVEVTKDEAGVVRVRASAGNNAFFGFGIGFGPDLKLVAHVPASVRARVRTEFGRILVQKLDQGCDLDLATSAGAIQLEDVVGRMVVRTGAGTITGQGVAGTFDMESAAGAVKMSILGLQPGKHQIRTQMGAVRVDLAANIAVKIETRASMGSVRVKYPSQNEAPAVLSVSTELGAVKVGESGMEDPRHGDYPRWDSLPGMEPGSWPSWPRWGAPPRPPAPPSPPAPPVSRPAVGEEELKRILAMVEQGKITANEAERLIRAIEQR